MLPPPAAGLKAQVRALAADGRHPILRALSRTASLVAALARAIPNRRLRSEILTRYRHGSDHFQGSTFTLPDRYPLLFDHCRLALATLPAPRILSFGCSTGEEVVSLARYLPHAQIVGADINPWALNQCRRHNHNPRLTFVDSASPAFAQIAAFDAIFCLAVFQRTENNDIAGDTLTSGFLFQHFAQAIALLDRKLNPGGLLYLDHCDFSFADTDTAARYIPHPAPAPARPSQRPLFGPDNRRKQPGEPVPRVFQKQS